MINFKSEKGAALILTLVIITLFLVFILTQFYQITNTTKQVTTMEKQIDARLIAEMGVDYYRSFVQNYIDDEGITDPGEVYITEINLPQNPVKLDSKDHKFSINDSHIEERTEEKVTIKFISIGTAFNKEKEIKDTIIITFESEG
ncbi:hypothetical protein SAMN05216232_1576 [Virgibacillus subterraneus]|uniref:Type II secretory pathway, pseudopilin PulG n=2 Tax=Virgibacillus TaxID=84406 RepID=A0A1H1AUA7_9BACI|nr:MULTISPECIES: hypothetical protein [Virgibacillus]SDQ43285.1 hypothetical protein SAMN05216231_1459 [Virgibacillus salinus]SEQ10939.1 hypothetical protein SAMN05216232_1576 [Virgibacillus subterraneus]